MGVDRHLLGLKLCAQPGETHAIFSHPIFAKSSKWQLSTSALISGGNLHRNPKILLEVLDSVRFILMGMV
jgi:hypothetical protein